MTSPDERIDAANAMRDAAEEYTNGNILNTLIQFLNIDFDGKTLWHDMLTRLADFIDPTCHAVHSATSADDELVCSECGATLGAEIDGRQAFVRNFCPCCGARVVCAKWPGDNIG